MLMPIVHIQPNRQQQNEEGSVKLDIKTNKPFTIELRMNEDYRRWHWLSWQLSLILAGKSKGEIVRTKKGGEGRSSSFDGPKEIFVVFTYNTARSWSEGSDKRDVRKGHKGMYKHTQRESGQEKKGMSGRRGGLGGGVLLTLFLVLIVESFGPQMPPLFLLLLTLLSLLSSLPLSSSPSSLGLSPVSPILFVIFLTLSVPCVHFILHRWSALWSPCPMLLFSHLILVLL